MKSIFVVLALVLGLGYVFVQSRGETAQEISRKTQVAMKVEGMTCHHCAQGITAALKQSFGAEDVAIVVDRGDVKFSVSENVKQEDLTHTVESMGYKVTDFVFQ